MFRHRRALVSVLFLRTNDSSREYSRNRERERGSVCEWKCVCVWPVSAFRKLMWPLTLGMPLTLQQRGVRGHMTSVWALIERSNTLRHVRMTAPATHTAEETVCIAHWVCHDFVNLGRQRVWNKVGVWPCLIDVGDIVINLWFNPSAAAKYVWYWSHQHSAAPSWPNDWR